MVQSTIIKLITLLSLSISLMNEVQAQALFNPPTQLKGEVAVLYESSSIAKGYHKMGIGFNLEQALEGRLVFFNDNNQPTKETLLFKSRTKYRDIEYEYEGERLQQLNIQEYMINAPLKQHIRYDDAGKKRQVIELKEADTLIVIDFSYEGDAVVQTTYRTYPPYRPMHQLRTWDQGRVVQIENLSPTGELEFRTEIQYQDNGEESATISYDAQGNLTDLSTYTYEYDEQGNWIRKIQNSQARGVLKVHQRYLRYRGEASSTTFLQRWIRGDRQVIMDLLPGKKMALIDLIEESEVQGDWRSFGEGKFTVTARETLPIRFRSNWANNRKFDASVESGCLILDGSQNDFMVFFPLGKGDISPLEWSVYDLKLWETANEPSRWDKNPPPVPEAFQYIAAKYEDFKAISGKVGQGKRNGLWGLVNNRGVELTDFTYDYIRLIGPDQIKVVKGDLNGLLTENGEEILPLEFNDIRYSKLAYIGARKDNLAGIYSPEGEEVVPLAYEKIDPTAYRHWIVFADDQVTLLNLQGEVVVPPGRYHTIRPISPNCFMVRQDGLSGTIDSNGQVVIPLKYQRLERAGMGFFQFFQAGIQDGRGLVTESGAELIDGCNNILYCNKSEDTPERCLTLSMNRAIALFRRGNEWGSINGMGRIVSHQPPNQRALGYFYKEFTNSFCHLYYPKDWYTQENLIYNQEQVRIEIQSRQLPADSSEWLNILKLSGQLETTPIGESSVPVYRPVEYQANEGQWVEWLFFPQADGTVITLQFSCPKDKILQFGPTFYDIAGTLQLQQK